MAFDEGLAQRVRELLEDHPHATAKKMFGGLGFMISGNMCVGVMGDGMVVRVGPPNYADALSQPYAQEFDFTGKPMKGWVMVAAEGLAEDKDLAYWLGRGEQFASALMPKS
ncbi:MAG: TfoX/Sxy family protein [Oceanospirillaceae bacterium]|jgi:TfoX/Sxy family transcriptional regulator of competence genes|nr:TfoX/Sxy family protein [Oceanospirillaceae bacterium]MBT4444179.1 TfoX/Sxy family protein [Oceanospirillaceae bacterium]MBT6077730.1 TfoX/Sxy family protein [Oceanospirillaceae bacterium]MBT7330840.1 TfoX/Sxy family protein [Oceanospirillaceae bacterium]